MLGSNNKRLKELNDFKVVLSTQEGQRVFWRILKTTHLLETSFNSDTNIMSYNTGQADIGKFILSEIQQADQKLLFNFMLQGGKNDRRK